MTPNMNMNITKDDVAAVACNCGCDIFSLLYKLGRVNSFKSPTGKETYIHMPVYVCASCGEVMDTTKEQKTPEKETPSPIITK